MKQLVSLVLVLCLCAPGLGWTAETQAATAAGSVSPAGGERDDGPLARAARRAVLAMEGDQQQDRLPATVAAVREAARRLPPGVKVRVRTMTGGKVEGTLVSAGDKSILVETRGGLRQEVPYETLKSIEEQGRGMPGWGKALIITGVAVGALFVVANCVAAADSGGRKTWCN